VTGAAQLVDRAAALQETVTVIGLQLSLAGVDRDEIGRVVEEAWNASTLPVTTTRKGRTVIEDLRPSLRRLEVVPCAPAAGDSEQTGIAGPLIEVEVATRPRGVRPADLLGVLRGEGAAAPPAVGEDRVLRTNQWIERDGARLEPLEADRMMHTSSVGITSKGRMDDQRQHAGGDDLRDHREPATGSAFGAGLRIA
jgi:hypothetical protein